MLYEELVRDFAHRTRVNLEFIEKAEADGDKSVYPVTQLLNSMTGMLIFPVETYIKKMEIQFAIEQEFEALRGKYEVLIPKNSKTRSLDSFLGMLRNSFSHANIEVKGNGSGDITSVILWNYPNDAEKIDANINWKIEITVDNLRSLALLVVQQIERHIMAIAAD